jgi:phosphatidylserine decarboxylase
MIQSPKSTEFLDDKEPYGWFSPTVLKKVDYSEYDCNPEKEHYGFKNWN